MSAPKISHILIQEDEIRHRIEELGAAITEDYVDRGEIVLICVLKGGMVFMSDLMRQIKTPHTMDTIQVSSYGIGGRESTGELQMTLNLGIDLVGKHVLVVEDIIDSGHTLQAVVEALQSRDLASLEICALLDKPSRRKVAVDVKYIGFTIPDKFIVGYGIDADEQFRHLPYIATVAV